MRAGDFLLSLCVCVRSCLFGRVHPCAPSTLCIPSSGLLKAHDRPRVRCEAQQISDPFALVAEAVRDTSLFACRRDRASHHWRTSGCTGSGAVAAPCRLIVPSLSRSTVLIVCAHISSGFVVVSASSGREADPLACRRHGGGEFYRAEGPHLPRRRR